MTFEYGKRALKPEHGSGTIARDGTKKGHRSGKGCPQDLPDNEVYLTVELCYPAFETQLAKSGAF